jgi:hypothetical protein
MSWTGAQRRELLERSEPAGEIEGPGGVVADVGTSGTQRLHLQELDPIGGQVGFHVAQHRGADADPMLGPLDGHQVHLGRIRAVIFTVVIPTSSPSTGTITDG